MNKKQIEKLKEILKEFKEYDNNFYNQKTDFLIDNDCIDINLELNDNIDEKIDKVIDIFEYVENKNYQILIKLNNLLDEKDKDKDIKKLEEEIKLIQNKKYITVNEFEKIFNISKSSQRDYRSKLRNPLPYHQKIEGGKIVYVVDEVEKWFSNQYK
jgi:hypothetical protein